MKESTPSRPQSRTGTFSYLPSSPAFPSMNHKLGLTFPASAKPVSPKIYLRRKGVDAKLRPITPTVENVNSKIVQEPNRYEGVNIPLHEHNRIRIVKNVAAYIEFFCCNMSGVYSLADIEDLIRYPVILPLDLAEQNMKVWKLLARIERRCASAGIHRNQWFDILVNWKPKLTRVLNHQEFTLGLIRLCEETESNVFHEQDVELLYNFFLRHPGKDSITKKDWRVGFKKRFMSHKRIEWFNHQAAVLQKCQKLLDRLKISFKELSRDVLYTKFKKQHISSVELSSMVSVLISDYIAFINCKHVDELLPANMPVVNDESKRRRSSINFSGNGFLSFNVNPNVPRDDDDGDTFSNAYSFHEDDDMSAFSLLKEEFILAFDDSPHTDNTGSIPQQAQRTRQSSLRQRIKEDIVKQIENQPSYDNYETNSFANHLAPDELSQLEKLVQGLQKQKSMAIQSTGEDSTEDDELRSRSLASFGSVESFLSPRRRDRGTRAAFIFT